MDKSSAQTIRSNHSTEKRQSLSRFEPVRGRTARSRSRTNQRLFTIVDDREAKRSAYFTANGHIDVERVKLREKISAVTSKQSTASFDEQVGVRQTIRSMTDIDISGLSFAQASSFDVESPTDMHSQPNRSK